MYYIGEISYYSNNPKRIIIELWDDKPYSYSAQAKKKIMEIKRKCKNSHLEIIDDKEYDIAGSQHWE